MIIAAIVLGILWLAGVFVESAATASGIVLTDPANLKVYDGYPIASALNGVKMWNPMPDQASSYGMQFTFDKTLKVKGVELVGAGDGTHDIQKAEIYDGEKLLGTFSPMSTPTFTLPTPFTGKQIGILLYPNSKWQVQVKKVALS